IHIMPDTAIIKKTKLEDLPYILLDVTISSLKVNGVKTDKALLGSQMIGDSVVIDKPDIIVYFLKPLQKKTNINTEATTVYKEILGSLNRIQASHVFLNNVQVKGINYFDKEKIFDLNDANIQLTDVLIDSSHNLDASRTLFCKQIGVQVASFISYDNARPKIRVKNLNFSGAVNLLSFGDIEVNRFESANGDSSKFLHASNLSLEGIDANEIVKNKNIFLDTIKCNYITIYQPTFKNAENKSADTSKTTDTTGFAHVYSIEMKHLSFPKITFIPQKNSPLKIGNIAILVNDVKADQISDMEANPLKYSTEAEIVCDKISMDLKDGLYNVSFLNTSLNSLHKELKIGAVMLQPFLGEKAFAAKSQFQTDRYDVSLKGIVLKNIDMQTLIAKKIVASDLIINSTSAKIYRDLNKPLDGKSKVGNYPSQMLLKLKTPVKIEHASLPGAFIQYTEHEKVSDSSGVISFVNSDINISNITNDADAIKKNNEMVISFDTKVLNKIPLKGSFKFFLNSSSGNFAVEGHTTSQFDAMVLNKVSIPMALIRLRQGTINNMDFAFTGGDQSASGDFVMKYNDLKVDVLKIDKDSKDISKKGFTSLLANTLVKNDNPNNGNLRKETPHYDRDIQKSFFNLIWKTIFTGMKKTVGIP
ncbi:MAG: hypothetical protein M3R50_01355, partial [Bacteroidota bacterium]|nr:hypothetical protein [Bacteroidota bacterium]